MADIKSASVGIGFISSFHIDAIRRAGFAEVSAVSSRNCPLAKKKAEKYNIKKCYERIDELLADPAIPAALFYKMA
jgi:predicted dehydrogenase